MEKQKLEGHDNILEQNVLKKSIYYTISISILGLCVGVLSGSSSIVFDGMFSALDAGMCTLSLLVSRLLSQPISRSFQYGFWHVEPMVLAFNGCLLILLCSYAFINAIKGFFDGGVIVELGMAMIYTTFVSAVCFFRFFKQSKINVVLKSDLIALDNKSWLISACISTALLFSFILSWGMKKTYYESYIYYIDPLVLAILSLFLIFIPIGTVIKSSKEILQVTPKNLARKIDAIMAELNLEYGFLSYSSYATRIGRGLFIEIHIIIPKHMDKSGVYKFDVIRNRISDSIGEEGPHRWLTISFTHDPKWL